MKESVTCPTISNNTESVKQYREEINKTTRAKMTLTIFGTYPTFLFFLQKYDNLKIIHTYDIRLFI